MIGFAADYWMQYTALAVFSIFLLCFFCIRPRFGISASLLLAAVSYSAIYTWLYVPNRYVYVEPYNQMALRYFAADSLVKLFIVLAPLMVLSKNRQTMLLIGELGTASFVLISACVALWEARRGCNGLNCGGLIGNASISMGAMVCMLPIFIHSWKRQWMVLIPAVVAILLSKSSVAFGLLVMYAVLHLAQGKRWKFWLAYISSAVAVLLCVGKFTIGKELLNDSDRFMIWRFMFDRWRDPRNIAMGTGFGTFHVIGINLQHMADASTGTHLYNISPGFHWVTLHNDPLQMLFECGIVGLVLLCVTYCSALIKVVKEKQWPIAMSILLFGAYMCLDPALHNPVPILFGAWLFVYALRNPGEYV